MSRRANKLIPDDFPTVPGLAALEGAVVSAGPPADGAEAVGLLVGADGPVPSALGLDREALSRAGFTGEVGTTLVVPATSGPSPVAVGMGDGTPTAAGLRDAAAAFARATARHGALALVAPATDLDPVTAAQALVEGVLLARYRYLPLKHNSTDAALTSLSVQVADAGDAAVSEGIAAAFVAARATVIARDLANTPPGHLTAPDLGEIAVALGRRFGFGVELFGRNDLVALGCGGLLGVNRGSAEEPRMIVLTYEPAGEATGHVGMIGKGIMYDSGGISLKPSDPMHLLMKMDMGGAAAVLGAFCALRDRDVSARATGWLMCTDNMPSSTAYTLGDVLTTHGGTTIEVKNTDAEGRLVMSDAFDLAVEEGVDALFSIATLTGAALLALGPSRAPVFATDDAMASLTEQAALAVDEPVWRLPLEKKYRSQLDSQIADIANIGGKYAGATTAALFLQHFAGDIPWAHLDIAGTMQTDTDDSWRSAGATGFGARLLWEAASRYTGA